MVVARPAEVALAGILDAIWSTLQAWWGNLEVVVGLALLAAIIAFVALIAIGIVTLIFHRPMSVPRFFAAFAILGAIALVLLVIDAVASASGGTLGERWVVEVAGKVRSLIERAIGRLP
ncbi:MAG: hypothetical protein DRJ56_06860 [Thermoprotei archaeon]|nr:MAG: hypothetical protein DRJ56_06860 [Thermoprotei archaeon]